MKRFRKLLFWLHLFAGVTAGAVILIMSGTGVILALKPQIQNWIDRDVRYVTPAAGAAWCAGVAGRGQIREAGFVAAVPDAGK